MMKLVLVSILVAIVIKLVDGGYRTDPEIELFLVTKELSPPEPRATWAPCRRFMKNK